MLSTVLVEQSAKAFISCQEQARSPPRSLMNCVLPCRSQHIFVRSDGRSGNSLAYTCVGDPGNALTCNDGYHVRSMAPQMPSKPHQTMPFEPSMGKCCVRRSLLCVRHGCMRGGNEFTRKGQSGAARAARRYGQPQ